MIFFLLMYTKSSNTHMSMHSANYAVRIILIIKIKKKKTVEKEKYFVYRNRIFFYLCCEWVCTLFVLPPLWFFSCFLLNFVFIYNRNWSIRYNENVIYICMCILLMLIHIYYIVTCRVLLCTHNFMCNNNKYT